MKKHSLSERLRYRFDNMMAKGNASMIKMLLAATLLIVVIITVAIHFLTPPEERDIAGTFWDALASAVNAWMPYSDDGGITYVLLTALAAGTGLLFTSILIGIIASAIEEKVTGLKEGNSVVLEQDHVVVLGFVSGEYTLIRQLIAAARGRKQCILVAGELPRSETDEQIRENVEIPKNIRLICRTVAPGDVAAMAVCSIPDCRTVVVNYANDADIVKGTLAAHQILSAYPDTKVRVISNVTSEAFLLPRDISSGMNLISISIRDVIARVIAHSCTETGISAAYTDLFDIQGGNIRLVNLPAAVGKPFAAVLRTMDSAVPLGVVSEGRVLLNPDPAYTVSASDRLICWAEDGREITFAPDAFADAKAPDTAPEPAAAAEHTVLIGDNPVIETLLRELPERASRVTAVGIPEDKRALLQSYADARTDVRLAFSDGDADDDAVLSALLADAAHVVILADGGEEDGDVVAIMRYLRVNSIKKRGARAFSVTLELRSEKNLQLVSTDDGADFIVAPHIVSMFLAQLADCPDVAPVFRELLSNTGSEIHLKPASAAGADGTVSAAELRARLAGLKMILLGYVAETGTVLNPALDETVAADALKSLIVISEN